MHSNKPVFNRKALYTRFYGKSSFVTFFLISVSVYEDWMQDYFYLSSDVPVVSAVLVELDCWTSAALISLAALNHVWAAADTHHTHWWTQRRTILWTWMLNLSHFKLNLIFIHHYLNWAAFRLSFNLVSQVSANSYDGVLGPD